MARYRIISLLILLLLTAWSGRCEMTPPLKIPLLLSANFGELRSNHFHSGIDLKTQGRTGLSVYAMDDGYVARIVASPWGFGRAIYINHPSGLTTVYGHLESFADFIDKVVRQKQYTQEEFRIDCEFAAGEIPVKKGQIIGKSGNSGSSGGAHLHLDIRDTQTQDPLDPLPYFSHLITDHVAPEARRVVIYFHDNFFKENRVEQKAKLSSSGKYTIADTIPVWGNISMGLEAYDRMTDTQNIYGVRHVELFIDDHLFFSTDMERFTFDESRYINSYAEGNKIMRTYIAPGNHLKSIYKHTTNRGILSVDEERLYRCRYELTDFYGNRSTLSFSLMGVPQKSIPQHHSGQHFSYATANQYHQGGLFLSIPAGALYDDINFVHKTKNDSKYVSGIHTLSPASTSLHQKAELSIPLTIDNITDKSKYYMVRINGKRVSTVEGSYQNGCYTAKTQQLGSYAIAIDTIPPTIQPVKPEQWSRGTITLKATDNESGFLSYRGEIDGKFVLFELDGKSGNITYRLEPNRVKQGGKHTLQMTVTDRCGNEQTYKGTFPW